jgi:GTPase involved in cell partitioning and DNA repair
VFNRNYLYDELRRIEQEVVRGEQQLAEQEELLVCLKTQYQDTAPVEAFLDELRSRQRALQEDRSRILSMMQP